MNVRVGRLEMIVLANALERFARDEQMPVGLVVRPHHIKGGADRIFVAAKELTLLLNSCLVLIELFIVQHPIAVEMVLKRIYSRPQSIPFSG